jgi:hypothetical protein
MTTSIFYDGTQKSKQKFASEFSDYIVDLHHKDIEGAALWQALEDNIQVLFRYKVRGLWLTFGFHAFGYGSEFINLAYQNMPLDADYGIDKDLFVDLQNAAFKIYEELELVFDDMRQDVIDERKYPRDDEEHRLRGNV